MSSRDNRERDRRAPASSVRTNEYFVPKDGIDREVITADICRYLGNDALVRPGSYENPQTRQIQAGYFINAYRNLTTAMISDLKADSERWDAERRATRGAPNVEYRASTTHQSRQYYGPTENNPPQPPPISAPQQEVYNPQSGYASGGQAYTQPVSGYGGQPQGYPPQENYYVGGHMGVHSVPQREPEHSGRGAPLPTGQTVPRSSYPSQTPTTYADSRSNVGYYPPQQPTQPVQSYGVPQTGYPDYNGRAAPVTGAYGDSQDDSYDNRYQETPQYSQASIPPTTATANQSARRGDRDRDQERDRHSSHRNRR